MSTALQDVAAERARQIEVEGWNPAHDDGHRRGEIAGAAACYILNGLSIQRDDLAHRVREMTADLWPWSSHWWKPKDRRRDLLRAAALIVAEIERLDRLPEAEAKAFAWTDTSPSR